MAKKALLAGKHVLYEKPLATRFAPGHKNTNSIEVNRSKGSLRWDFTRMNELEYFSFADDAHVHGWHTIQCSDSASHPYAGSWWPAGHHIGYEHCFTNMLYDYLHALASGTVFRPDFADGVAVQEVVEAALASAASKQWVKRKRSRKFAGPAPVPPNATPACKPPSTHDERPSQEQS